jgi:hypothetical protein
MVVACRNSWKQPILSRIVSVISTPISWLSDFNFAMSMVRMIVHATFGRTSAVRFFLMEEGPYFLFVVTKRSFGLELCNPLMFCSH